MRVTQFQVFTNATESLRRLNLRLSALSELGTNALAGTRVEAASFSRFNVGLVRSTGLDTEGGFVALNIAEIRVQAPIDDLQAGAPDTVRQDVRRLVASAIDLAITFLPEDLTALAGVLDDALASRPPYVALLSRLSFRWKGTRYDTWFEYDLDSSRVYSSPREAPDERHLLAQSAEFAPQWLLFPAKSVDTTGATATFYDRQGGQIAALDLDTTRED